MVIDHFDVKGVIPFETENDPPVGPRRHGPEAPQIALERMQAIPGYIQSLRRSGGIENGKNSLDRLQQVGPDALASPRS